MSANTGNEMLDFIIDTAEHTTESVLLAKTKLPSHEFRTAILFLKMALSATEMEITKLATANADLRYEIHKSK